MTTVQYTVPDISCGHCKMTIEKAVGVLDGVQSVAVDVPTKGVAIVYDPDQVTPDRLEEVLAEEGYPVNH